ncbi:hypothetical protein [Bordetella avium]|uniref:Uncharacterized protein n=1 Tax=Bordetella avium (strain 197N) TaxID=360910 RepID=Q2KWF6_BORA1|nr:hypothetical protein [Bordetella avium]AZY50020.1 hypothetical protein C0J09_13460 [Bordetella avium]AZY53385.1 hypothetical protein C0J07_13570 [Bordetella avium]RIQ13021.1 hypothetical protein D0432_10505 [Bordetella avium]RIQ17377.1 hypothetical protein D0850_10940 [Bordetella avium]RIQ33864.1 hypothetical protein D0849_09705 [Bordetella avium]
MTSRMIGDFRVRCSVIHEEGQRYGVRIWTRRVGGTAPEKAWDVPSLATYVSLSEAEMGSQEVFRKINGVRFNGEPEFAHASA